MDKVKSALFPGSESGQEDENSSVPWWMRWSGKLCGVVGGGLAIFFGFWATLSFTMGCWVGGPWQIVAGVVVIAIEFPICATCIPQLKQYTVMVENRPPWQKAIVYLCLSLPPFFLCDGFSIWVGSGLILGTALLFLAQTGFRKGSPGGVHSNPAAAQPDETNIMDDPGDWNNP